MTDTGQFPVEGQPEGAGGEPVPQHGGLPAAEAEPMGPGWAPDPAIPPAAPAYTFLDQPDEEDDLLLMPGPQGSWSDPQAAAPAPGQAGGPVHPQHTPFEADPHGTGAYAVGPYDSGVHDPAVHDPAVHAAGPAGFGTVPMQQPFPGAVPPPVQLPEQPSPYGDPLNDPLPPHAFEQGRAPGAPAQQAPTAPTHGLPHEIPAPDFQNPDFQNHGFQTAPAPVPQPWTGQARHPQQTDRPAPRRPLHMGPPIPEQNTGGVAVRSLADRGPAVPAPTRQPAPAAEQPGIPAQQSAEPQQPVEPQPVQQPAEATGPVEAAAQAEAPAAVEQPAAEPQPVPEAPAAPASAPEPQQAVPAEQQAVPAPEAVETVEAGTAVPAADDAATPAAPPAEPGALPVEQPVEQPAEQQAQPQAPQQEPPTAEAVQAEAVAQEAPQPDGTPEAAGLPVEQPAAEQPAVEQPVAEVEPAAVAEQPAAEARTSVPDNAPAGQPEDGAAPQQAVEPQLPQTAQEAQPVQAGAEGQTAPQAGEAAPAVAVEPEAATEAGQATGTPVPQEGAVEGEAQGDAAPAPAPVAAADDAAPVAPSDAAAEQAEPVAARSPETPEAPQSVQTPEAAVPAAEDAAAAADSPAEEGAPTGAEAETGDPETAPAEQPAEAAGADAAPAVDGQPVQEAPPGAAAQPEAVEQGTPQPEPQPVEETPAAQEPSAETPAQQVEPAGAQPESPEAPAAVVRPGTGRRRRAPRSRTSAFLEEPAAQAVAPAPEAIQPQVEAAPEPVAEPQAAAEPAAASEQQAPEPTAPEPTAVEPTAEEAAAVEPVVEEAAPAEPVAEEEPSAGEEQPAAEQSAAEEPVAEEPVAEEQSPTAAAPAYDEPTRDAVHRVIRERRDIRNGFRKDAIPHEVLIRVLEAAHTAPSVGHSQPWDFVVIRSAKTRRRMHELAVRQRDAYAKSLPKARAKQFKEIKIEAILETPVNIVVTADPTRGGRHTLGRHTQPQMAPYSSALAVENLWLAARAEGLGVGWVSFFDEREMVRELGLPDHLEVVAYLCVGYVDEFPDEPELMQAGWAKRRPLSWAVHEEEYGRRALPGEEPHDLLDETLGRIRPLDAKALGEAWERQKRMTKPAGSLGMLEIISAQLSGLSRQCPPPVPEPAAVAIFAGDHGVHAQGVTAWPQEVTGQMVANFLAGGAVCNAFANQVGAEVCVVDVGVAVELPATAGLLPRKVRPGTDDFTVGPAMSREEVLQAIEVGIETARDLVAAGNKALLTGEMGVANTTASAALISVYTGVDPAEVTGRGTGITDDMHAHKVDVVRRALELHRPDPEDPIGVLAAVGGLEHAAMVGLMLGGASLRTPIVLDGVSTGAAALVARAIAPEVLAACIAGHRSAEPGHVAALNKLGLRPLIDLDLRLGEGTGALLALPLVQSAARAMHEVATFDSAGVTEKE
ncbi:nicotinate-nucleotide--dimethylbenzimidazole phosphoribosyltransferase [Streptomyces sp. NPDC059637]|uniref:nicotinate-nucleotide--dimethylbenzimidazole phosphoribosyltransferase n=1 Tax=Streptomyces sp. NPDC059637 TaxID=3347752 RepID=UPI0036AA574C